MSALSRRTLFAGAAALVAAPAVAAPCKHEMDFWRDTCRHCGVTARELKIRPGSHSITKVEMQTFMEHVCAASKPGMTIVGRDAFGTVIRA